MATYNRRCKTLTPGIVDDDDDGIVVLPHWYWRRAACLAEQLLYLAGIVIA